MYMAERWWMENEMGKRKYYFILLMKEAFAELKYENLSVFKFLI